MFGDDFRQRLEHLRAGRVCSWSGGVVVDDVVARGLCPCSAGGRPPAPALEADGTGGLRPLHWCRPQRAAVGRYPGQSCQKWSPSYSVSKTASWTF